MRLLDQFYFFYDKISQVQKRIQSTKSTTNLRFIDLKFIDLKIINIRFIYLKFIDIRFINLKFIKIRFINLKFIDTRFIKLKKYLSAKK